jgi:hypothetical protein
MSMLKDADGDRPADAIAPGANAEGKVVSYTPEEAAKLMGQRDADEEAFAALLDDGDAELREAYQAAGEIAEEDDE